ncbi:MAG TPA: LysM peptidoglycan-binding domain-containing protein [Dehalococcoidia bacterium]
MNPRTDRAIEEARRLRGGQPRETLRRELILATLVVVVYGAVFGSSLYTLAGGHGAPDFLHLRKESPAPAQDLAQVQGARSDEAPAATAAAQAPPATTEQKPPVVATAPDPRPTSQPAQPAAANTVPVVASVSGRHLVQSGDTLSGLGLLYHVDAGALKLINGLNSDMIYVGQTLAVPRPDEASQIFVSGLGDGGLIGD